jgi:hypothetical protein
VVPFYIVCRSSPPIARTSILETALLLLLILKFQSK